MRSFPAEALRCFAITVPTILFLNGLPAQADDDAQAQELRNTFEAVAAGTLDKRSAGEECLFSFSSGESASSLRQFMAGFLQEPQGSSLAVYCDALVEAVVVGRLKPQTIYETVAKVDKKTQGLALGRVLRAAYFFRNPPSKSGTPGVSG